MHIFTPITLAVAAVGAVRIPPHFSHHSPPTPSVPQDQLAHHPPPKFRPELEGLPLKPHKPTISERASTLVTVPPSTVQGCYYTTQKQCLNSAASRNHNSSALHITGCSIIAEINCKPEPVLPSFCPDSDLVKRTLEWTPPPSSTGCAAAWKKCLKEIPIPFFNRPVCAQYLPVLCKDTLNEHDEQIVDHALEVLYEKYDDTLDFFYDHVPGDKALWFDECIDRHGNASDVSSSSAHPSATALPSSNTTGADSNDTKNTEEQPGPAVFFSCLDQVKNLKNQQVQHPSVEGTTNSTRPRWF